MAGVQLVYGIIEDPGAALTKLRAAPSSSATLTPLSATLGTGTPALRLNSHGWINWTAETAAALPDTDALLKYCREQLQRRTVVFSLSIRTFINACLDFAASEVERRRDELEQRLDTAGLPRSAGFPDTRDFVFSAFLPLPNVFIAVDDKADEDSFVRVDVLLWDGKSALAVMLEGRSMPTPRTLESLERLRAAHPLISILRLPWSPRGDASSHGDLPTDYLGRFLDGVALPFGPYRVLTQPR